MQNNNPGCLGMILQALHIIPKDIEKANTPNIKEALPYGLRDDFLSYAELSFFKVLQQAIGDRAFVFAKVSLGDIFFVKRHDRNQAYYNKIARKHVDFLVCSLDTLKPIAGIELDDRSHQKPDRVYRDRFVEEVFECSKLLLIRYANKSSYTIQEIREKINFLFQKTVKTVKPIENNDAENSSPEKGSNPICPKCGIDMVRRTVNKGPYAGKKFYGCSNYPKCREVIEI